MIENSSAIDTTILATIISCIVGFLTSFFFYRKQKKKSRISYSVLYNRFLDENVIDVLGYNFKWNDLKIRDPFLLRVWGLSP